MSNGFMLVLNSHFWDNYVNIIVKLADSKKIVLKENFEWIFFDDSLKMLFDNFSKQLLEFDKKWIKSANKNKDIGKLFKDLDKIYDRCK